MKVYEILVYRDRMGRFVARIDGDTSIERVVSEESYEQLLESIGMVLDVEDRGGEEE